VKARATRFDLDNMNRTEERYSRILDVRIMAGEVHKYFYASAKLRIGDGAWYTPDFLVILSDGTVEYHEIKGGYIREAAMVRYKVAKGKYPYVFRMWQYKRKRWKEIA